MTVGITVSVLIILVDSPADVFLVMVTGFLEIFYNPVVIVNPVQQTFVPTEVSALLRRDPVSVTALVTTTETSAKLMEKSWRLQLGPQSLQLLSSY